ncbi:hypothetical protein ScPMuIL_005977 [Solemya velum]
MGRLTKKRGLITTRVGRGRDRQSTRGDQTQTLEAATQSDHSDTPADETEAVVVVEDVGEAVQSEESQTSPVDSKKQRAKKTNYSLGAEEALWREKGQQLGRDAAYLRGWWRFIKDNFTRLNKKESGDETKELAEREKWILSACSFVRPLVRHKSQPLRSIKGGDTLAEAAASQAGLADAEKEDTCHEDTSYTRKGMKREQDDTSTLEGLQEN